MRAADTNFRPVRKRMVAAAFGLIGVRIAGGSFRPVRTLSASLSRLADLETGHVSL